MFIREGCTFIEELKLKYVIMETAYDGIWLRVKVLGCFLKSGQKGSNS